MCTLQIQRRQIPSGISSIPFQKTENTDNNNVTTITFLLQKQNVRNLENPTNTEQCGSDWESTNPH